MQRVPRTLLCTMHRVVYHARLASDVSRRVVGEACRRVRGEQAHQALVCPDHVKQEASNGVTGRMCTRTGECRASCSEGGGAQGEGVEQIGQSTRGPEGQGGPRRGAKQRGRDRDKEGARRQRVAMHRARNGKRDQGTGKRGCPQHWCVTCA